MYGTSAKNFDRLQRVQNSLARVVCQAKWTDSASGLLRSLHWLPVRERTRLKMALITIKIRHSRSPSYLADLNSDDHPARLLRSRGVNRLYVPRASLDFGSSAFSVAAPTVWNSLSTNCRVCTDVVQFKTMGKT